MDTKFLLGIFKDELNKDSYNHFSNFFKAYSSWYKYSSFVGGNRLHHDLNYFRSYVSSYDNAFSIFNDYDMKKSIIASQSSNTEETSIYYLNNIAVLFSGKIDNINYISGYYNIKYSTENELVAKYYSYRKLNPNKCPYLEDVFSEFKGDFSIVIIDMILNKIISLTSGLPLYKHISNSVMTLCSDSPYFEDMTQLENNRIYVFDMINFEFESLYDSDCEIITNMNVFLNEANILCYLDNYHSKFVLLLEDLVRPNGFIAHDINKNLFELNKFSQKTLNKIDIISLHCKEYLKNYNIALTLVNYCIKMNYGILIIPNYNDSNLEMIKILKEIISNSKILLRVLPLFSKLNVPLDEFFKSDSYEKFSKSGDNSIFLYSQSDRQLYEYVWSRTPNNQQKKVD